MRFLKFPIYLLAAISIFLLIIEWKTISHIQAGTDFSIYYNAAMQFRHQPHSLYDANGTAFDQYLYPPPAILLFAACSRIPLSVAYMSFILLMYACLFASLLFMIKIARREGYKLDNKRIAAFIIFAMACSPVFHNITLGQINHLVLLLSVLYIYFLYKRPVLAGAFLAFAIWIKLYPILLLVPALFSSCGRKSILSCAATGLVLLLALLPWLPITLYRDYAIKLVDASRYTSINIINQSFTAFLMRLRTTPAEFFQWPNVYTIPSWIKWTNYIVLAAGLTWTAFRLAYSKQIVQAAIAALAFVPMFSTLGWGHSYVYILPLLFFCMLAPRDGSEPSGTQYALIITTGLLLLIPVYNSPHALLRLPAPVLDLYYSRLLLITALFIGILTNMKKSREKKRARL